MNRGRGAGSILPFLLDPSDPTSAGIDNQDNCFRWNQIIHIPSGTNEGEPASGDYACDCCRRSFALV